MKFVTFQNLTIKNFLSVGEEEVSVSFNKGLHVITGLNKDKQDRRNGVGKSTIADALYFVIFGSTIRDIKKDYIPNNLTNGTCCVELTMNVNSPRGNDDFLIKRTINPSKLIVLKNGVDKTRDSIANTTDYICSVISCTPELFQNCVIMTLNNTLPFMGKTKSEKRKFIEQIFNLQVFSDMATNLRLDNNEVSKNFDIEQAKLDEVKNSVSLYTRQKESKQKEKIAKIENINSKISKNNNEIVELEEKFAEIEKIDIESKKNSFTLLENAYKVLEKKIEDQVISTTEIKSEIKTLNVKQSQIGTDSDVCPTCLRPIEHNDRNAFEKHKKEISDEISLKTSEVVKNVNNITSLKDKLNTLKSNMSLLNDEISDMKSSIANKAYISKRIQDLSYLNKQLTESIDSINHNDISFDEIINETNAKISHITSEIDNLKNIINLLEVVKFVVSEEGVKSYIVRKILQNFNNKLAFYLKKMDSNSICFFNEYFEEEIVNEKGKICSYNNFSGAERKAIDLACLFSFIDMRKSQGNVHFNVSIYDELLDSSLDEKGVELVLGILKERSEKYNESVMIISHRKESVKAATGDIIFLEKRNGITKRVKFTNELR